MGQTRVNSVATRAPCVNTLFNCTPSSRPRCLLRSPRYLHRVCRASMSFAGTPLGQGRRLDYNSFLGKPAPADRPVPTSYSFGCVVRVISSASLTACSAPALGSRSPPKPTSARERPRSSAVDHHDDLSTRPTNWTVNDTSVRLASAIAQAADMNDPNSSWAAGAATSRPVPRSTSVEYEAANTSGSRRFAAPPRRGPSSMTLVNHPLGKATSTNTVIPDSEGEDNSQIKPMSLWVRQRSQEPSENVNNSISYDYSQEERDFQNQNKRRATHTHKRSGMSTDNKAYKPTLSDFEVSDDDQLSDDGRRRRKSKKKDVGRVNTLPVIGESKQRKKRKKALKVAGQPDSDEEDEQDVCHQIIFDFFPHCPYSSRQSMALFSYSKRHLYPLPLRLTWIRSRIAWMSMDYRNFPKSRAYVDRVLEQVQ